ncbi:hypothetical protein SAMN05446037_101235 [Anaerovirgula multivorans]|uniref:Uncharacterized protein n=1 Tax=Anaerovirgula multivorans TaxID=312168 RepID=A0A239F7Q0_9FIRM|nr:hypothetical protein SAMN05446037_101235 [Anaerovirgula multivorans]
MILLFISLTAMMYIFIRFTSSFAGSNSFYCHRVSYLCEILSYQNLLNKDILYLDVIIDIMISTCIISTFFLTSLSNHLIMSLDILLLLYTLLIIIKYILKNSITSPVR